MPSHLRTDSVATIETEGLVCCTFLAILTGSDQAPPAPVGSMIAGKEPFEIADLMQQMSATVKRINMTIDDLKDDVQHAVQSIGQTVDQTSDLIAAVTDDVTRLASASARITGDVAQMSETIRSGKGTIGRL